MFLFRFSAVRRVAESAENKHNSFFVLTFVPDILNVFYTALLYRSLS